jgi:hypothetical protein
MNKDLGMLLYLVQIIQASISQDREAHVKWYNIFL